MKAHEKFTWRYYFQVIAQLLGQPRAFFSLLPVDLGMKRPLLVLIVSSIVFAVAGIVSRMPADPVIWGGVLFVNALGMVLITAGAGFAVMVMTMGKRVAFARFFSIYALSSGVALLVSWIPFTVWIAEPYKWWLIGTGMTRSLGFKRSQAVLIIAASISGVVLFFWSLLFLVAPPGG
ncbi:MAG: hypothetical protein JJV98_17190 [Desulfosarcina sp.]|nr:hypothetical protein [Desulfobacterales bacterium]